MGIFPFFFDIFIVNLNRLLAHLPQLYLLGTVVKLFLEQGQFLIAKQMGERIKKVCDRLRPDLDSVSSISILLWLLSSLN